MRALIAGRLHALAIGRDLSGRQLRMVFVVALSISLQNPILYHTIEKIGVCNNMIKAFELLRIRAPKAEKGE